RRVVGVVQDRLLERLAPGSPPPSISGQGPSSAGVAPASTCPAVTTGPPIVPSRAGAIGPNEGSARDGRSPWMREEARRGELDSPAARGYSGQPVRSGNGRQ